MSHYLQQLEGPERAADCLRHDAEDRELDLAALARSMSPELEPIRTSDSLETSEEELADVILSRGKAERRARQQYEQAMFLQLNRSGVR